MTITLSKNVMTAIGVILAITLAVLVFVNRDTTEGKYVDKSGFSCPYLKAGADDAQTQQDYEDLC